MTVPAVTRPMAALRGAAADLPPVGLDDLLRAAALQSRTDRKYLVTPEQLVRLLDMPQRWRVLQIDRRRMFRYESVYFDTEDLALYRAHRQERRRRYKVRVRRYLDGGPTMVEVKTRGLRGQTVKHRAPYQAASCRGQVDGIGRAAPGQSCRVPSCPVRPCRHDVLSHQGCAFVQEVLQAYGEVTVPELRPTLVTTYQRVTVADLDGAARLTCDVGLRCHGSGQVVGAPQLLLLESKVAGGAGAADRWLSRQGVRPVSLSKYAVGTALVNPGLAANRWNRVLRHDFGWRRADGRGPGRS